MAGNASSPGKMPASSPVFLFLLGLLKGIQESYLKPLFSMMGVMMGADSFFAPFIAIRGTIPRHKKSPERFIFNAPGE